MFVIMFFIRLVPSNSRRADFCVTILVVGTHDLSYVSSTCEGLQPSGRRNRNTKITFKIWEKSAVEIRLRGCLTVKISVLKHSNWRYYQSSQSLPGFLSFCRRVDRSHFWRTFNCHNVLEPKAEFVKRSVAKLLGHDCNVKIFWTFW